MKLHLILMEGMTLKRLMRLELLVSSLLPVAAILVLGLIGTEQIADAGISVFVLAFVLCALAAFFGELCVTLLMQQALRKRLHALAAVCQDYVAGNKTRRAWVHGDDEITVLARELNTLLDASARGSQDMQVVPITQSAKQEPQNNPPLDQSGNSLLHTHVEQLLQTITPATSGDLRVRAEVTSGIVGVVADAFNYLIEELAQFVKQMRFASDQVLSVTRDLLDRSIELAKVVETQMLSLSHTTEKLETLVAFTQRLSDTLELSLETSQEMYDHLREEEDLLHQVPEKSIDVVAVAQKISVLSEHADGIDAAIECIESLSASSLNKKPAKRSSPKQEEASRLEQKILPNSENDEQEKTKESHAVLVLKNLRQEISEIGELSPTGKWKKEASDADTTTNTDSTDTTKQAIHLVEMLRADMLRHMKLLGDITYPAQEHTSFAETAITELYMLARQTHHSSMSVLNTAERISSLAVLAEQWRDSVMPFRLPNDKQQEDVDVMKEASFSLSPALLSPFKNI